MIEIKVPATSANMGCGFDCIGVALNLYNHIWIEKLEEDNKFIIEAKGFQASRVPTDERNLIYKTIKYFYNKVKLPMPSIHLIQEDFIPMSRGLGSSAACIVGGLLGANKLAGDICSLDELSVMASDIEGHPDNTNPALFGGLVLSLQREKSLEKIVLPIEDELVFATMVPSFSLSTREARRVLPKSYTREDVVFNATRTAFLMTSLIQKKYENLSFAVEDRIHQPYRSKLIPNMDDVFEKANQLNATATYLSGAGPTLMVIIKKSEQDEFKQEMEKYLKTLPDDWTLSMLTAENQGATIN